MPRLTCRPGLLALALLAACAAPQPIEGFRAQGPIYSNAVLDLARIEGSWAQVATFAGPAQPRCRTGQADITAEAGRLAARMRLCLNGGEVAYAGPLAITGPGRMRPAAAAPSPLDRDWWLLWADADLRTLVLGTPDGSFGMILNRGGRLPPDRLTAARDILAWNGYDVGRLRLLVP